MIEFENIAAFFLLLFIPVFYFLRYAGIFRPIMIPLTLGNWKGHYFQWPNHFRKAVSALASILAVAGFTALVTAYANPVVHKQEKVYSSRGADILFVLDTSPSMAAQDMSGLRRIDAAIQVIHTLESTEGGDSIGLIEMAKEAAVVVPPTMDRNLFFNKLDSIVLGELGDGTAIGNGLTCAIMHLESSKSPRKSIVLITDGEQNSGTIHPDTACRLAKEKNIMLYIVGIGTTGSALLEYVDPITGQVYSDIFNSSYDATLLAKLAAEADGKFYEADNVNSLAQTLDAVERSESIVQTYHIKNTDKEYYPLFTMLGSIFLLLAVFLRRFVLQEVL